MRLHYEFKYKFIQTVASATSQSAIKDLFSGLFIFLKYKEGVAK
jgi:hypothetical protein